MLSYTSDSNGNSVCEIADIGLDCSQSHRVSISKIDSIDHVFKVRPAIRC